MTYCTLGEKQQRQLMAQKRFRGDFDEVIKTDANAAAAAAAVRQQQFNVTAAACVAIKRHVLLVTVQQLR